MTSDPTQRFSNRVDNYVRYRPHYPPEIVALLQERIGLRSDWTVADIGSGTGISAEAFIGNGNRVFAVEPNAEMRGAAERIFGSSPNFISVEATAEATTLPDESIDLAVAAQAFHWFDHDATRRELLRILRGEKLAVLMWNIRSVDSTPFLREYEQLLLDCGTDYAAVRHENVSDATLSAFFTRGFDTTGFPHEQAFDYAALEGRLLSSSYVPAAGESGHETMILRLEDLFSRHARNGRVVFEYEARVHYGRL
jgi:SAM-dependent methyltransferase